MVRSVSGFVEASAVSHDGVQPASELNAERRWQGVLHPSAARDEGGAMFLCERAERLGEAVQITRN